MDNILKGDFRIETSTPSPTSSPVLEAWNALHPEAAASAVLPCCGSIAWANSLAARRPLLDEHALLAASTGVWFSLPEADWQQAFNSHPRIGERKPQTSTTAPVALAWSASEQSTAMAAEDSEKAALREANARYEQIFGRIFIICARGRSAHQILTELNRRLGNTPQIELQEAAQQQAQITDLRLRQWLAGS